MSCRTLLCVALALQLAAITSDVRAQQPKQAKKGATAAPSWLKDPVEAPNLSYKKFQSAAAKSEVSYLIYLPPSYERDKDARFPVVYWLHGRGGGQQGLPAMTGKLTKAIEEGKTPPLIMVFVNGLITSSYVDSFDGKWPVETVAIQELIPHIDQTYRTIATREGRMIEGFSMGGGGAAKWGFRHPELFGAISIVDGAMHTPGGTGGQMAETFKTVYGGNEEYFAARDPWKLAKQAANQVRGRTTIRIVTAEKGLRQWNQQYHELLDQLKLAHEFRIIPGATHSPGLVYDGLGDQNWAFYREAFRGVAPMPTAPAATTSPASTAAPPVAPYAAPDDKAISSESMPSGFVLNGTRWTYRDDQLAIRGILVKPEGKGPFPAVLISHGLGGSAATFGMEKANQFVKWGYVCIAVDYTHTGGQGQRGRPSSGAAKGKDTQAKKAPGPRGTSGDYGASPENLRRAVKCLDILEGLPEVDKQRIYAYGNSMGAFLTVALAAEQGDRLIAAAITAGGVSEASGFAAPTTERAAKIRIPICILHGGDDTTVPPQRSELLKRILDENKVVNERHVFPRVNHPLHRDKADEVNRIIHDFFEQHSKRGQ